MFFKCHNYQIAYFYDFYIIFDKVYLLFRIRILQKVSDTYGSGSTTL
jgi:hypothetical protein